MGNEKKVHAKSRNRSVASRNNRSILRNVFFQISHVFQHFAPRSFAHIQHSQHSRIFWKELDVHEWSNRAKCGVKGRGQKTGFHEPLVKIIWQSVPKAGVARAGAATLLGNARLVLNVELGLALLGRAYSTCSRPLSKYRRQFSPAKWIVETSPILGDHCHVVSLLAETC